MVYYACTVKTTGVTINKYCNKIKILKTVKTQNMSPQRSSRVGFNVPPNTL